MTVRKRGSRWWYDFRIRGVRYRGSIPEARTKAQAMQAEATVRTEVYEGRYGRQLGLASFSQFVNEVYIPWSLHNKRSWRSDVPRAKMIAEYFRGKKFAEISPLLIEKFKRERAQTKTKYGGDRKANTVNAEFITISRVFRMAIDNGLVESNPCSKVRKLRADPRRERYLSYDDEERLFETTPMMHGYLRPLVKLALLTGMRKGELLSLRWSQVDYGRDTIHVVDTKNGHNREVPMSDEARNLLQEMQAESKSEQVFLSPFGKQRSVSGVHELFHRALREASITDFRFHDLRHTAATRMAEAGIDAFTIASILGHSNVQMTARYAHATSAGRRRAVEALSVKHGHNLVTSERWQAQRQAVSN